MDEPDEPQAQLPQNRGWLPWALVAGAAAAALWLAALPLDRIVPEPQVRAPRVPDLPLAAAPTPAPREGTAPAAPEGEAAPPPLATPGTEALAPPPETAALAPPATEWFEETPGPGESAEPPPAQEALRDRLQRQLAMNDLHGVRVEIAGDRIVTSGVVAAPGDRQRLALIVRSLAPDLVHEDHAELAGR